MGLPPVRMSRSSRLLKRALDLLLGSILLAQVCLIDPERAVAAIQPSLHIGLDRFVERAPEEIPQDRDVVVYCHVGARSAQAAVWLKASGWTRVRSLAGGIDAWSQQVDPEVPRYR